MRRDAPGQVIAEHRHMSIACFLLPHAKRICSFLALWAPTASRSVDVLHRTQASRRFAQWVTADLVAAGGKPYYIPAGASTHPLGGLGFAR
ncbi:hypothetical protein B0H17DRAFT_1201710 [Mycena rosella]|uniref:Uncharacterized protein n=1 Tax=Mycena rosella TaxID=1033263 RepID=A0AAD7GE86_MYCRO|nr:hypothetical protein B0H17DRAFT_1201710 [Mycena rosella]